MVAQRIDSPPTATDPSVNPPENPLKPYGQMVEDYIPLPTPFDYHMSPQKFRFLFGGNRSSKTHASMMDLTWFALGIHPMRVTPANAIIWACTVNWEMVGEILWGEKLSQMLPFRKIMRVTWHSKSANIPKVAWLTNGNRIVFKAFEQGREAFQGKSIHAAYCDEQARSDSEGIFREIQARLVDTGGFYSHSLTPLIPCPWLEQRVQLPLRADAMFFANLNDNRVSRGGYVADEEIDLMIEDWPEEVQETRIKGLFAAFEGVVYKTFRRDTHVIPRFTIPSHWERYRGIDFGFSNPFACVWLARSPDGDWHIYNEYQRAGQLIATHAAKIKRMSQGESYRWTAADHDAQGRAEINAQGISTVPAKKDVLRGIEVVQSALKIRKISKKPRLFIHDNCPQTAIQFAGYRWPEGTDTKDPKEDPIKKDDHLLDPIRYIIYAVDGNEYMQGAA